MQIKPSSSAIHDSIQIYPSGPLRGALIPPSSKYHTLRYTLAACLASGESIVHAPAISDDTEVLLRACTLLGAEIRTISELPGTLPDDNVPDTHIPDAQSLDAESPDAHKGHPYMSAGPTPPTAPVGGSIGIRGVGNVPHMPPGGVIDVGNAGAVLRLLMGICVVLPEPVTFVTEYPESLGRRPNADLLQALAQLGVVVESHDAGGTLPLTLYGGPGRGVRGGKVRVSGKASSQYISSLLFLAPLLPEGLNIEIMHGLVSSSFVDLTAEILREAGITIIEEVHHRHYIVPGMQTYRPGEYHVPGDYPSAAALLAATAVTGGEVTLANLPPGDAGGEAIMNAFAGMGMQITRMGASIHARPTGPLRGISFDGNSAIDSVPVIASAACFAETPSRIYNVAHLRLKESDRIRDLATELNKAGCRVIPSADAIEILPVGPDGISGGVTLDGHSDHRLIQACSIAGLGSRRPITINGTFHIAKSYPNFFDDLISMGATISI